MTRVAAIYRHPVKSLGSERLERAELHAGRPLPHDRVWAVLHGAGDFDFDDPAWADCRNFVRVTHAPLLAQVRAAYDAEAGRLTLSHPDRPDITVAEGEMERLTEWMAPLAKGAKPGPYRIARAPGVAMTDVEEPYVSLLSLASLRALSERAGAPLDPLRFRGNFWVDDLPPWEERAWIGREIRLGAARLRVVEPIDRCAATHANPATGRRDVRVVDLLRETVGDPDFGLFAEVIEGGVVAEGDPAVIG